MFLPYSFFSSAYSSSKAQLPRPRYPRTVEYTSKRLNSPDTSIKIGNTIAYSGLKLISPKKSKKEAQGIFMICRQLQQSGQHTRARFIEVNIRLLAAEFRLCSANILYTLILKIVCVTMQATYIVRKQFHTQLDYGFHPINGSTLIGVRKRRNVASYPKKITKERTFVRTNRIVQYTRLCEQLFLRQDSVMDFRSSTSQSSWFSLAFHSKMRFFTDLCSFALLLFDSSVMSSSNTRPREFLAKCCSISAYIVFRYAGSLV